MLQVEITGKFTEELVEFVTEQMSGKLDCVVKIDSRSYNSLQLSVDHKAEESEIKDCLKRVVFRKAGLKSLAGGLYDIKIKDAGTEIASDSFVISGTPSLNIESIKTATRALFKVLLVAAIPLTVACGANVKTTESQLLNDTMKIPDESLDPMIMKYVAEFEVEANMRGYNVDQEIRKIRIANFSNKILKSDNNDIKGMNTTLGYCEEKNEQIELVGGKKIKRSYKSVLILNPSVRFKHYEIDQDSEEAELNIKRVIYHELAHCLLNLDHTEDYEESGIDVRRPGMDIMARFTPHVYYGIEDEWESSVKSMFDMSDQVKGRARK